jgi:hypothetical protein
MSQEEIQIAIEQNSIAVANLDKEITPLINAKKVLTETIQSLKSKIEPDVKYYESFIGKTFSYKIEWDENSECEYYLDFLKIYEIKFVTNNYVKVYGLKFHNTQSVEIYSDSFNNFEKEFFEIPSQHYDWVYKHFNDVYGKYVK